MKGNFTRVPPGATLANGSQVDELTLGWFAISHRWINDKSERRKAYGKVYKISSKHGTVYRTLRFSPKLKGSLAKESGQILMDWHGWIGLSETGNEKFPEDMKIKRANPLEIFYHSMSHPDPAYRHSMAVARVGLYISLVSIILAFK